MSDEQQQEPEKLAPNNMSFRSPNPISAVDGYILAVVLRLVVIRKTHAERTKTDGVSVLTMANMEHVVPLFAYFKHRMEASGTRTVDELREIIQEWGGVEIERWVEDHPQDIFVARHQLGGLFDAPNRAGFSCYDG